MRRTRFRSPIFPKNSRRTKVSLAISPRLHHKILAELSVESKKNGESAGADCSFRLDGKFGVCGSDGTAEALGMSRGCRIAPRPVIQEEVHEVWTLALMLCLHTDLTIRPEIIS